MVPDPFTPEFPWGEMRALSDPPGPGDGTIVASGNDAHYVPVIFPADCVLYSLMFAATNGTGNYDMGLYNASLARLASSGSTAMSAAGTKTLTLPELKVRGGDLYFAAFAFSSTSAQIMRPASLHSLALRSVQWGHEASALPLPATATPVTTTAYTVIPWFAFGVR